jgi:hypothetical protein
MAISHQPFPSSLDVFHPRAPNTWLITNAEVFLGVVVMLVDYYFFVWLGLLSRVGASAGWFGRR